jgi:hypothetical protein
MGGNGKMKIRFVFLGVVVACEVLALPSAADEAATIDEIKSAVLELDKAYADEDRSTIERLILPNHVSIAPRYGGAATLNEQVDTFEQLERAHFDYSPIEVELLSPDIALVTFEKSYSGTYKGVTLPPRVFVSEVWLRQSGMWRQRIYQETPIEKQ